MTYGPQAYDDLLKMEGQIRKQRQETLYAQREARKHFAEAIAIIVLVLTVVGFFIFVFYLWHNKA